MFWSGDNTLARRAQRGDKNAFGTLYDRHSARVYNFLRRLSETETEAEDLTQETFIAAFRGIEAWRGEGAWTTWLLGIALRVSRNARRRAHPTETLDEDAPLAAPAADPFLHIARKEQAAALEAAIAALPPLCREAFVLLRVENLPYKEAATLLQVPLGTVQSRLWRATLLLRAALSPYSPSETDEDSPGEAGQTLSLKGAKDAVR